MATNDPKFPDAAKIASNFKEIINALGLQDVPWFVSIGDLRVREKLGDDLYNLAIREIKQNLALPDISMQASALANWRKPAPGMLLAIAEHFNVEPGDCLFVGDMETDRQAAEAAGMQFEMVKS